MFFARMSSCCDEIGGFGGLGWLARAVLEVPEVP
jgi:hypothetical protein